MLEFLCFLSICSVCYCLSTWALVFSLFSTFVRSVVCFLSALSNFSCCPLELGFAAKRQCASCLKLFWHHHHQQPLLLCSCWFSLCQIYSSYPHHVLTMFTLALSYQLMVFAGHALAYLPIYWLSSYCDCKKIHPTI